MLGPKVGEHEVSHLFKNETVPKRVGIDAGGFEPLEFGLDRTSEERPLETRGVGSLHDGLIYFIQQPGDRGEEVRLQNS